METEQTTQRTRLTELEQEQGHNENSISAKVGT